MNSSSNLRRALSGIRHHPVRAALICVPLLAVTVFTGSTMASATPAPTLAVPSAEATAAPAPHVLLFDDGITAHVAKVRQSVKVPDADGCDHDYGNPNQCVPWTIPAGSPAADCAWLRSNGFGPLQVMGTNRQHLPETTLDGKTYACA